VSAVVAVVLFAVFACALRRVLLDHGSGGLFADLALAGTLLGITPGPEAETVNLAAALRAGDEQLSEPLAATLFDVSYVLGSYAIGPGLGLLAAALGLAALRSPGLLPRPLALAGLVVAAALVTPRAGATIGEYTAAPPLVLVVAVGSRLLRGAARPPGQGPAFARRSSQRRATSAALNTRRYTDTSSSVPLIRPSRVGAALGPGRAAAIAARSVPLT
jgi:hypothetical protein